MAVREHVIAVVDDDPGVRKALARLLSVFGYRVELFASAPEFLRVAATSEAACLLVDIQLGDMSGLTLARHLSAAGFEFPIIFMSGSAGEAALKQSVDLGSVAFLRKPFPDAGLIDAIAKAIRLDLPVA
jgi:FixJ family two-component response regulator